MPFTGTTCPAIMESYLIKNMPTMAENALISDRAVDLKRLNRSRINGIKIPIITSKNQKLKASDPATSSLAAS